MKNLPKAYLDYVKSSNVLYGETDYEFGGYFDLEPLDTIEDLNRDIEIETYVPGYTAFASDGGGEVFVFNPKGQIFLMPLVGMEPEVAVKIADSWVEFQQHIISNE